MKVNYLGHVADKDLGTIGRGLSISFKWGQEQKPVGSMLVGTSPEFELALYTTCILARSALILIFHLRPQLWRHCRREQKCQVRLRDQKVSITTHLFTRPRGVEYVATAYPEFK